MIQYISDADIFLSQTDALVNPVNCKGFMGKGIALEFKKRFPECVQPYKTAVSTGKLVPGTLLYVHVSVQPDFFGIRKPGVILFPTKDHWKGKARLEWIEQGLTFLQNHYKSWGLSSIAMPQLGCGLGGLDWGDVQPVIERFLSSEAMRVEVYLRAERRDGMVGGNSIQQPAL